MKLLKAEQEKYRLNATIQNRLIIQLNNIQLKEADNDFSWEVARFDKYGEWMQGEREFRLICSLWMVLCNIVMNPGQDRRMSPVSLLREPDAWRGKIGAVEMSRTITERRGVIPHVHP